MANKMTERQKAALIVASQNAIQFVVSGKGSFPVDMLRYDLCWPSTQTSTELLNKTDQRSINMRGLRGPTVGRWQSFGWSVNVSV